MFAYLPYALRYYARSYRYVPPLLLFFVAISMFYKDPTNQVLSSLSFGNFVIFLTVVWLANGYIELEHETQQQLSILHIGSAGKYYLAKLLFISCAAVLLAVYTLLYPLALRVFTAPVTATELLVSFAAYVSTALLGVSVGIFFNGKLIARKSRGILLLFLFSVLSLAGKSIADQFPHSVGILALLLPPVSQTVNVVSSWMSLSGSTRVWGLVWPFVYSFACMGLYLKLMSRGRVH